MIECLNNFSDVKEALTYYPDKVQKQGLLNFWGLRTDFANLYQHHPLVDQFKTRKNH